MVDAVNAAVAGDVGIPSPERDYIVLTPTLIRLLDSTV